jgi:DNA-binding HxlR family transcriptional regulator
VSRRSYAQFCGLAKALDVVGERWTLLVVRNLLLGPLRYSELLRGLPGITTNLLAKRLREMEENGMVEKVRLASADSGFAYRLTPLGRDLEPAIHALGRWGFRRMGVPEPQEHRDLEWLLVALRRRYLGRSSLAAEVRAEGVPYRFLLSGDSAEIGRGAAPSASLRVSGPAEALAWIFLRGIPAHGVPLEIRIEQGDADDFRALVEAFRRGD